MSLPKLPKGQDRKEILLLNPIDHRGQEMDITQETDLFLKTREQEQIEYYLWKPGGGPGWKIAARTIFLAVETSPIVGFLDHAGKYGQVTIEQFLRAFWGPAVDKLPPELRNIFEKRWAAMVTIKPPELGEGAETILDQAKAQLILRRTNIEMLKDVGESVPESQRDWITTIAIGIAAFFVGVYLKGTGKI